MSFPQRIWTSEEDVNPERTRARGQNSLLLALRVEQLPSLQASLHFFLLSSTFSTRLHITTTRKLGQ